MNSLDQVNSYLRSIESRLRWTAASRGLAAVVVAALLATVILVLYTNAYAFSAMSLRVARPVLFLCLALAIGFGLVVPLLRLNRRRAARHAEVVVPEFKERLLTFTERQDRVDPFLELLAADTMDVASRADASEMVKSRWIAGGMSAATVGVVALIWLIAAGPGFWGHGASLLWAGTTRPGLRSAFYDLLVTPGNRTVRRNSDQVVTAQLVGFTTSRVNLFAKFKGTSKWEQVPMQPRTGESAYEFLFAGLPDSVEYYVEASGVKSGTFKLTAIDLPGIKKARVTYHYPKWMGLKDVVEEGGGDLRAIEGSEAELALQFDKPLSAAVLILDDETRIELQRGEGLWMTARVPIKKDGMYHVAAIEKSEDVRLSEDFFIEAQKEQPPVVRIARPGKDFKVNPIEEVSIAVEADDDFGLQELELHYSVNGAAEKTVPLLKSKGSKTAQGETLLALEDFKLVPGDIVSFYARARDARNEVTSDMMFLEAQPFEREYSQSQLAGGGGGGGGGEEENNVSLRQKEIISATFNQVRDKSKDAAAAKDNAKFLSDMQAKLRDQSKSLAQRMRSRELSGANAEFQTFVKDMDAAAVAMGEAVDKLKTQHWKDAIPPEQKALQHLLRAEATRRQIQVAFGARGGGGGGGGAGRDLDSLFDLELDTEKNQYETGQQNQSADQRSRDLDEALQKLERLAKRQQELAQEQRNQRQTPQQRWQQEMLRREAEELQRKMEQMAKSQQRGQQGQQGQQGQSGQQGGQGDPRIRQALDRLSRATEDMRRASSAQAGQQGQQQQQQGSAEARRAADRLKEATDALRGMRQQESGNELSDLARRAEQLAQEQKQFVDKLKQAFPTPQQGGADPRLQPGQSAQQTETLARDREGMMNDLNKLEKDMQSAVRNLAGTQRGASSKLREALGDMQQNELKLRMKFSAESIRRGYGPYLAPREGPVTQGLDQLRDQVKQAQASVGNGGQQGKNEGVERALNQVERIREQLESMMPGGQKGQRGQGQQGQQGQGQQGQQGQGQQGQQGQGQQGQGQGQQGQQGQGGQGQQGQQGQGGQGQQSPGQQGGGGGQQTVGGGQGSRNGRNGDGYGDRFYRSGEAIPQQGQIGATNPGIERAMREGVRELSELRQEVQDSPELANEIADVMREIQKYDPARLANDPLLAERIRASVLPAIQQLELQLRRKLESSGGDVRSSTADRIPPGYGDAVAEYFRKLSKSAR